MTALHNNGNIYGLYAVLMAAALGLRFQNIAEPSHVCWDEVHFGKYAANYINRTLFLDVHPPLGKIILAVAGVFTGFNGEFPFNKPGDSMLQAETQYIGMRQAAAVFGAGVVPLSAAIVWLLTGSLKASLLTGLLTLTDTALIAISRYILLDPFLQFFILLTCFCFLKHRQSIPFSSPWWLWLASTGVSLSSAVGVKFVGLFVVSLIGISVIYDLWTIITDKTIPLEKIVQHILARFYSLVCLPVASYCFIFVLHFVILNKSGTSDGYYSSLFQSTLVGNPLYHIRMPEYVAFGSEVTIKNSWAGGGYLHSHNNLYPKEAGPELQQVTSVHYKDDNNVWIIRPVQETSYSDDKPVAFLKNGDKILLEHKRTRNILASHGSSAPLTKNHRQAFCQREENSSTLHGVFEVRIASGATANGRISPMVTVFQLRHVNQDCVLHGSDKQLPKWGFEHGEVTCNPDLRHHHSYWNVEIMEDARLPDVRFDWKGHSPGFLSKFIESHQVMFYSNRKLEPVEDELEIRPWMWPIAYTGQLFSAEPRIMMLGNPFSHWLIIAVGFVTFVLYVIDSVKYQRLKTLYYPERMPEFPRVYSSLGWLFLGWMLHYIPFWTMARVLYPHHYLSAYVFSAMFTGASINHLMERLSSSHIFKSFLVMFLSTAMLFSLYVLSPLIYGYDPDVDNPMERYQLLSSWDF